VLRGSEIALVDINAESLDLITELAEWLNRSWDCRKTITSHSSHKDALDNADYVVSAIEVQPRERLWQQDFELTLKYGLRQPYGENGGPGGFAHAARNVNAVLNIARDMERLCPNAWLINFTNPMHRLCYLVNQYSRIKVVGLCHQLAAGYAMAAKALAPKFSFTGANEFVSTHADPSNHYPMANMAIQGMERLKITAGGLNHFTWMLALQDRQTGEDLYPLFRQEWKKLPTAFEPLTREIFDIFNLFPIPGDEHLDEYLPWLTSAQQKAWEKYDLSLYDWKRYEQLRDGQWQQVSDCIHRQQEMEILKDPVSEGAVELIESLVTGNELYWEALNIPNKGLIDGLPENAIVEVPGTIRSGAITGEPVGELPRGITELLHREVSASQLCIDAVVQGDRNLALQSLLLDPVVDDIGTARLILADILETNKPWLPQFFE